MSIYSFGSPWILFQIATYLKNKKLRWETIIFVNYPKVPGLPLVLCHFTKTDHHAMSETNVNMALNNEKHKHDKQNS